LAVYIIVSMMGGHTNIKVERSLILWPIGSFCLLGYLTAVFISI